MRSVLFILVGFMTSPAFSGEINLAVASNFAKPAKRLIQEFEKSSKSKIKLSLGSTGKQYAQILQGAPFDIFFSADSIRPELLEKKGIGIAQTRNTYAVGRLVLWSPKENYRSELLKDLKNINFTYLALANPRLAPYGGLGKSYLQKIGLWNSLENKMVQGQNINQTIQFVLSKNAELGLLAFSQVKNLTGSYVDLGNDFKIEQQMILIKDNPSNREFLSFIKSSKAKKIIQEFGYEVVQ